MLLANVASECMHTDPFYKRLVTWNARYGMRLPMLLFPSDEFGEQELPSEQIPDVLISYGLMRKVRDRRTDTSEVKAATLQATDGGGVQLLAKGFVNGPKADPIWAVAKAAFPGDVEWNFSGVFLFDKNGICVGRYDAEKLDELGEAIDRLLA